MPNKNKQRNAFYFFMKEEQERLANRGEHHNMKEMATICHPVWKVFSMAQKQRYEEMAAEFKLEYQVNGKLASDGTLIRENLEQLAKEEEVQRQMRQGILDYLHDNRKLSQEEFIERNLMTKIYFISTNVLCRVRETSAYIPNEISLVEYSIKDGMRKDYHKFIHPGDIPKGYAGEAKKHSENTHHIPINGHEDSERDYYKIWKDIIHFIAPPSGVSDLPPMFCQSLHMMQNLGSLEWLAEKAGKECDLENIKVWDAAALHMDLREGAGAPAVSYAAADEELKNSSFDYTPGLKCNFHEEEDVIYCTSRTVKALCFIMSDVMCKLFGVPATEKHLPERTTAVKPYEVYRPNFRENLETFSRERGVGRGRARAAANYDSRPGSVLSEVARSQDSRPGSALSGVVWPQLPSRPDSRIQRNERAEERVSTTTPDGSAYDDSYSPDGSDDSETESASSVGTQNKNSMPLKTTGTSYAGILRQPVSSSIALSLARATAALAIDPGKGIGRGQRK